ncbi:hypothetical protein PIB30_088799 [Stylosanthes scabra]|uniref:Uncharacterized protein n=1 Tax=Stylosanthes scabra TaxID=79078 RepID=A0ABU6SVC8_9FABA|nr:hypothetical protein [Stylosanthes scabra]
MPTTLRGNTWKKKIICSKTTMRLSMTMSKNMSNQRHILKHQTNIMLHQTMNSSTPSRSNSNKKTQAQYLEELKALKTRQDDLWSQQNHFYQTMRSQQAGLAKEIEEVKKYQVNQTLMRSHRDPLDKMEEKIHETRNEIIEMRGQIKEWTRNASAREAYCCWAHQQANPNLIPIPACEIARFLHDNAAKKRNIFHGALKNFEQGEPSKPTDTPMEDAEKES